MDAITLFPLRTVLFPGGPLQLRIFETRYLDMVSHCLRENVGFGVCLIREGNEAGKPASTHPVGTMAVIKDWDSRSDGLLGITAIGQQRFRILDTHVSGNGLLKANVDMLPCTGSDTLPPQPPEVHDLLGRILALQGLGYEHVTPAWDSAQWLSCRLAEVLPLQLEHKQRLLELDDPQARLRALMPLVPAMAVD